MVLIDENLTSKSFFAADRLAENSYSTVETAIYKNGITNIVYIFYRGKWVNVDDLDVQALDDNYKRALRNSIFINDFDFCATLWSK